MVYKEMNITAECGLCKKQKVKGELFLDYTKSEQTLFYKCKNPCMGACCFYCDKKNLVKVNGYPYRFCETCQPIFEEEVGFRFEPEELEIITAGIFRTTPAWDPMFEIGNPTLEFRIRDVIYTLNAQGKFVEKDPEVIEVVCQKKYNKRLKDDVNLYSDQETSSEEELGDEGNIDPGFYISEEKLLEIEEASRKKGEGGFQNPEPPVNPHDDSWAAPMDNTAINNVTSDEIFSGEDAQSTSSVPPADANSHSFWRNIAKRVGLVSNSESAPPPPPRDSLLPRAVPSELKEGRRSNFSAAIAPAQTLECQTK